MFRNAFKRLKTEFGSTIQDDDIEIDSKFIEDIQGTVPGRVLIRARSTRDQTQLIRMCEASLLDSLSVSRPFYQIGILPVRLL